MEKIKEWLYFNYGMTVPVRYLWLLTILAVLILILLLSILFNGGMGISKSGSGKNMQLPGGAMPAGQPAVNPAVK